MNTSTKICPQCNGPVLKSNRKYCSPACNTESMKKIHHCTVCNTPYNPIRPSSKYCSITCFNASTRSKNRGKVSPPPAVPGAVWVELTNGKFSLIDEVDADSVLSRGWLAVKISRAEANRWYAKSTKSSDPVYLHHFILGLSTELVVDHVNGDSLDNRRQNLRYANFSQNASNMMSLGTTSKYKGVSFNKVRNQWYSRIQKDGVTKWSFHPTELEAAQVYDDRARFLHGEHGRYNFPRPGELSAIRENSEIVDVLGGK